MVSVLPSVIAPSTAFPPHQLRDTVLYLTVRGNAVSESGGRRLVSQANGLLVMPRGARLVEQAGAAQPWHCRYFLMRGPLAERFEQSFWGARPRAVTLIHPAPAHWRRWLTEIVQLSLREPPDWTWQVLARLGPLLDQVRQTTVPTDLATRAQQLILSQTDRLWTVAELARDLAVSPTANLILHPA